MRSKFTEKTSKKIIEAIKAGNFKKDAAYLAGVDESTFYRWLQKGRKQRTGKFHEFCKSIKEAESFSEAYYLERIRKSADNGTWQAAAWILERKNPEKWGRSSRLNLEHSGKLEHEGSVEVKADVKLSPTDKAELTRIAAKYNDKKEESES